MQFQEIDKLIQAGCFDTADQAWVQALQAIVKEVTDLRDQEERHFRTCLTALEALRTYKEA